MNYFIDLFTIKSATNPLLRWFDTPFSNKIYSSRSLLVKPKILDRQQPTSFVGTNSKPVKQKYQKSTLKPTQKKQLVNKLLTFMKEEKIYRQTDLSLTRLAKQLKMSKHNLSQIINEKLECSFRDFVNSYRVEEAKEKLKADYCQQDTTLAIGYAVGFNSKTAFYAAFKKQTGIAPGTYRKSR